MKITLSITFAFFFIISAGPSFGQTASEIMVSDTRDSDNLPGYYRHNVKFDFKQNAFIGLPAGTGLYSGMMSFAPWGDASGGWNYQLNFNHGGLYYRNGDHLGTWNSWQKLILADGNGNVGIGTDTPKEKLSVNGKIRAHEIKVETSNWPDYVFKSDYKLLPLSELESFVKTHNHLPEIPNALSIERDGLLLGEMNKAMLKKIEEMTLYIIDQQKLIEAQNKRLGKLEQLINKQN